MSDKQLDRLEEKVEKINDQLGDMNVTLARLTDSVVIHEKRSTAAETRIEMLKQEVDDIYDHVKLVNLVYKIAVIICGAAVGLLSILASLKKLGIL